MLTVRRFTVSGNRAISLPAILLVATLLLSCASCGEPPFSRKTQEAMEEVVNRAMSEHNIPGVIAGVWVADEGTWVAAKGKADIETGTGMEEEDKVRIASNTKPFVATVILRLVDEGRLSLDDRIVKFIGDIPYGDEMTVRQVCNMTSGVFSFTEDEKFQAEYYKDPLLELTPRQEIDIALQHEPYFPPGEGWHYSDTNYEILGIIIEKVTGNKLEDELRNRIVEPLNLDNTSLPTTPDMKKPYSHGYVEKDGRLVDYTRLNPSMPWAGGGMVSDLSDMKRWAKAVAGGELVSEKMHEEQLDYVDTGIGPMEYGLGVVKTRGFIGHHGAIFGYNSVFFHNPELEATIVVFANKSTNESPESSDIFLGLVKALFPEEFEK